MPSGHCLNRPETNLTHRQTYCFTFPVLVRMNLICRYRRRQTTRNFGATIEHSSPRSSSSPEAATIDMKERLEFLKEDLGNLFGDKGVDQSQYDKRVNFMDPITQYNSVRGYMFNIKMLKLLFSPTFQLHDIKQTAEFEITTRWTMVMQPIINKVIPIKQWWDPKLVFTGVSVMGVNPKNGKFNKHIDLWDALKPENQEFLSREGVIHVFSQLFTAASTSEMEEPKYTILKKKNSYEIRRYDSFEVVEIESHAMFSGKKTEGSNLEMPNPASADGHRRVRYFIANHQSFSKSSPPPSSGIKNAEVEGGLYAVSPRHLEEAEYSNFESKLRADGISFDSSNWILAQTVDPSIRLPNKRIEILIPILEFDIWTS